MLPLEGVTVVSLEQAVAAPFATRQLADLGARVIKVERPGVGDFARSYDRTVGGNSAYFVWLNRGKESLELDIKDAGDRMLLQRLISEADVFVQNLAPGAVEKLGLDADTLRTEQPDLIHCSISGYGSAGPFRDRKAYDLLIQCEAGVLATTGTPDTPSKVGISVADIATGMYAYSGILTALLERERHGEGSTLSVAMLDALGEWMSQPVYQSVATGREPRRTGARHATIAPYGPYMTGDGGRVFLAVQSDREWAVLCQQVLGRPELVEDPRFARNPERVVNDDHTTGLIEGVFSASTTEQVLEKLEAAGIASAQLRDPAGFAEHPQLVERNRWREVQIPHGSMQAMLPPVTFEESEAQMGDVPWLGQHNEALRQEFTVRPEMTHG